MADFKKALKIVLDNEGGYSNRQDDKGGETYCGISRVNNPNWTGWPIVDKHKPLKRYQKITGEPALDAAIEAIYKVAYWNKVWGENIKDQKIAEMMFDWFVTSGYHAVEAIQRIVDVRPDGVMGTRTVTGINNYPGNLKEAYKQARIQFYKNIAKRTPAQAVNLEGWLTRVNKF